MEFENEDLTMEFENLEIKGHGNSCIIGPPSTYKDAIDRIVDLANPDIMGIDGVSYLIDKSGTNYKQVRPDIDLPDTLTVSSLSAFIALMKSESGGMTQTNGVTYVFANKYDTVECYTMPLVENREERLKLFVAHATDIPGWEHKEPLPFESAMIAMRTRFEHTQDVDYLLMLLSNITNGAKVTYTDNGIATSVVTQKGPALQSNQEIKPIVDLKPYRTFQEIEQPTGKFHIRVMEKGIAFIEADGGMWKLKARQTIRDYLIAELEDLVEDGKVVVTI